MNKKLCLSLVLIFLFSQVFIVQGTNFHAVCVGISDYPGTGDDLPENCVNSAEDMKINLMSYQNWSSSNIELITNNSATENNITTAIGDMPNSTGNSELFFYSGHGSTSGVSTYSGTITPSELKSAFGSSFNQYCAFIDACNSGVFVEQMSKGEISSACKKSEDTYASGPDDYTYFGCFVLEGIENSAADPSSGHVVSTEEIHDYASPRVRLYAQSHNRTVTPQFKGNLGVLNLKSLGPTTSGNLIDSELWDQNVTLSGNITVPSGKILAIYNVTVNLNGYYIKCQGSGKIVKPGSVTISPKDISIKSGSDIKGQYPTIQSALNNASSGQTVYLVSDTYIENNNLTVNSGITLELKPGVTLKMASSKKLTINGTLKAEGTYSNRITFRSQSGTWYGIEFNNGSSSSRVRYCTIKNAQVGIHMIHTNVYLHDNKIEYNTTGLLFENYSDGSGIVNCHEISFNSSYGIRCKTYSDPLIFSCNTIHDNGWGYAGIYGDASSVFDLGRYSDQGHNSIYWNDPYEIQSSYSGTIYACYNWWDDPDPYPNVSSNVDWSNYLTSDPNTMLAKAVTHQSHSDSPIMKIAASNDTIGISEVDYAYLIYRKGDYQTATTLFETIIHKYPGHFSGRRALAFLYKCNKHLSKDSENLTLLDNVSATYPNKEIDALAKNISVGELIKQGDYQTAIAKSKAVTNSFADTEYSKYALFNLGSIYWYFLNDLKIGEAYYRQLIAAYPDDDLSISAMATLGEWNPDVPKKPEPNPKMAVSNSILKQFNLLQNYPNPFNPKTAIDFQIAKESKVSVVVYNLMGQKIRTLVEKNKQSGNYTVIWDGKNDFGVAVASGVYLYNLKAGKFSDIKKMILLR